MYNLSLNTEGKDLLYTVGLLCKKCQASHISEFVLLKFHLYISRNKDYPVNRVYDLHI